MAVAVKNTTETASPSPFDRLPVASLVGALYVFASLALAFYLVPEVWKAAVSGWLTSAGRGFVDDALRSLVVVAAAAGLAYFGARLVAASSLRGLRAGIFVGFVILLVIGLLTLWFGRLFDGWIYDGRWFGNSGQAVGIVLTVLVGIGLLYLAGRFFFRPSFEERLIGFEEQGWFSATAYKRSQGLRVRRGTMVGILALAGCGIYTMVHRETLGSGNWTVSLPFTGKVKVNAATVGDNKLVKDKLENGEVVLTRNELRDLNEQMTRDYVKIKDAGDSELFDPRQVVPVQNFNKEKERIEAENAERKKFEQDPKPLPTAGTLEEAGGETVPKRIIFLPSVKYTLPLLLGALALWFAWRIVNVPAFGDFLIATEAELNKVSWTTRKRLVQDTIVVLVTVVLMTLFLFFADMVWSTLLQGIGVLHDVKDKSGQKAGQKELPN